MDEKKIQKSVENLDEFLDADKMREFDTSWIREFNVRDMEGVAMTLALVLKRVNDKNGDGAEGCLDDELVIAFSTARSVATALNVAGKTGSMSPLTLCYAAAEVGYNAGVHDALEGELSISTQRRIAKAVQRANEHREALLEFHDQLEEL